MANRCWKRFSAAGLNPIFKRYWIKICIFLQFQCNLVEACGMRQSSCWVALQPALQHSLQKCWGTTDHNALVWLLLSDRHLSPSGRRSEKILNIFLPWETTCLSLLCLAVTSQSIVLLHSEEVSESWFSALQLGGRQKTHWPPVNPIQHWKVFSDPSRQRIVPQATAGVLLAADIYWKGRSSSKRRDAENWDIRGSPPSAEGTKPMEQVTPEMPLHSLAAGCAVLPLSPQADVITVPVT